MMHIGFGQLDPRWSDFAASLRKGQIYVKMPVAKARALGMVWHILSQKRMSLNAAEVDETKALIKLIVDEAVGSQTYGIKSVFYMISVEKCKKDITSLEPLVVDDETGVFKLFKEALEKGLQSDPEVDWIARVAAHPAPAFETLQLELEPVDVSLDDFFDFSENPTV